MPEPGASARPTSIWTSDDDDVLMRARSRGMNWKPIAEQYFPSKTPNACRKRHERLLERQTAEGWTVEDDGKTYVLGLREGLKFHDNEPVRSQDCIASIQRWGARDGFGQLMMKFVDGSSGRSRSNSMIPPSSGMCRSTRTMSG